MDAARSSPNTAISFSASGRQTDPVTDRKPAGSATLSGGGSIFSARKKARNIAFTNPDARLGASETVSLTAA